MARNRLARESSPYLLQHQDNPVDWYPWGEEALARARAEEKPILLSIGYSACHWCHVMAHESFEDEATAAIMNELFVNIKVDREERPDLDGIYMDAVTAMTGHGGWPMTVFLTPDGIPLYGGTYYPPEPRYGMPSFRMVLQSVAAAYADKRDELVAQGERLVAHIAQNSQLAAREGELTPAIFEAARAQMVRQADSTWGGFSASGPKFPQPMILEALLRLVRPSGDAAARRALDTTLTRMARGGMYDQLGGGFARYSVDEKWMVPHFEKMLYDNAQLATLYLHAWQATGEPLYRRVVEETLAYLEREMLDPAGAFFSSQDADSEGEEGRFFVWKLSEIRALLPADEAEALIAAYDITSGGNFEGKNVLWIPRPLDQVAARLKLGEEELQARLDRARRTLFEARSRRVAPGTDTKVITSWNALAIAAFAEASLALGEPRYLAIAERAATFVLDTLRAPDGRLLRTWRAGSAAKLDGYLEDYAYLADALLTLYEASLEPRWLDEATAIADRMLADFADPNGGFFDTGAQHEALVVRPKELVDNATPSGNAMAARLLARLAALFEAPRYREAAERTLGVIGDVMGGQPLAFGHWLVALDTLIGPTTELALIGPRDAARPFLDSLGARFVPNRVVVHAEASEAEALAERIPLLVGRSMVNGEPTAYLCFQHACRQPVTSAEALARQLDEQGHPAAPSHER